MKLIILSLLACFVVKQLIRFRSIHSRKETSEQQINTIFFYLSSKLVSFLCLL